MSKNQYVEERAEKYFFDGKNDNGFSDKAIRELQRQINDAMSFSHFDLSDETRTQLALITAKFFVSKKQEDELARFEELLKATPYNFFEWLTVTIVESMRRGYIIGFVDSFKKSRD